MTKKYILTTLLSILYISLYSQTDSIRTKRIEKFYEYAIDNDTTRLDSIYSSTTKSWGIIAGIGINEKINLELGYGRAFYGVIWHHWHFANYYLGSEFMFQNETFLIAPKISFWCNGGSVPGALGLNLLYYTDLNHYNNFVFRPEIGIGYFKFKLVWGYNISLMFRTSF